MQSQGNKYRVPTLRILVPALGRLGLVMLARAKTEWSDDSTYLGTYDAVIDLNGRAPTILGPRSSRCKAFDCAAQNALCTVQNTKIRDATLDKKPPQDGPCIYYFGIRG